MCLTSDSQMVPVHVLLHVSSSTNICVVNEHCVSKSCGSKFVFSTAKWFPALLFVLSFEAVSVNALGYVLLVDV